MVRCRGDFSARDLQDSCVDAHTKALALATHLETSQAKLEELVGKNCYLKQKLRAVRNNRAYDVKEMEYLRYFLFYQWRDLAAGSRKEKRRHALEVNLEAERST